VLSGPAADLKDIARLGAQKPANRRPDRFVIAVEGRRVQASIGRWRGSCFRKIDDELNHGRN